MNEEYADADNEFAPRDGDGGGYVGGSQDRYSLLLGLIDASDPVIDAIAETLPDLCWVRKTFIYVDPHEAMLAGWNAFVDHAKQSGAAPFLSLRTDSGREVFGVETSDGYVDAGRVLTAIEELTKRLGLVKVLPKGTVLYRCRSEAVAGKASELGSPPPGVVKTCGRMNRSGEGFFYGAFDRETAIKEACADGTGTVGRWVTLRPLNILDLTDLPPVPGFFHRDPEERHGIDFFHGFVEDLRKEVVRGMEEVDYLPSILVAEHYRTNLTAIDGIKYLSAKNPDGKNCVLFFGPEACIAGSRSGGGVLRLLVKQTEWLKPC